MKRSHHHHRDLPAEGISQSVRDTRTEIGTGFPVRVNPDVNDVILSTHTLTPCSCVSWNLTGKKKERRRTRSPRVKMRME